MENLGGIWFILMLIWMISGIFGTINFISSFAKYIDFPKERRIVGIISLVIYAITVNVWYWVDGLLPK